MEQPVRRRLFTLQSVKDVTGLIWSIPLKPERVNRIGSGKREDIGGIRTIAVTLYMNVTSVIQSRRKRWK